MQSINLHFKDRNFKLRIQNGIEEIWDVCRKKFVQLTPEERVRQHLIHLLIEDFHYPKGMIAVEKWIVAGRLRKRYDLVVYGKDLKAFLLIECKAPNVPIAEATILQISNYQKTIKAPYLLLSNGAFSFLSTVRNNEIIWLDKLPNYEED